VVDNHRAGGQAEARSLEGCRRREREGVRSTAAGDEHQPAPMDLGNLCERPSHGNPSGRDSGMGSGHRSPAIIRERA
jgi:hypothetical protein